MTLLESGLLSANLKVMVETLYTHPDACQGLQQAW